MAKKADIPQVEELKFEEGVATLDLDTLKRTVEFTDVRGNYPKARPINHADFIGLILDKADKRKVLAEAPIIFVDQAHTGQVRRKGEKEERECKIEDHLIQRLVARINLKIGNGDMNLAIALAYNDRGLSIAYGVHVNVCKNQNIFGSNIIHTYGDNKAPYDKVIQILDHWFNTIEPRWEQDFETIKQLQTIQMVASDKYQAIGEMMDLAVVNNLKPTGRAMLNQTQVADFIRASHEKYPQFWTENGTAWDFLNAGTEILKPQKADFVTLNDTVNKFSNFVLNRNGIKYDTEKFLLN